MNKTGRLVFRIGAMILLLCMLLPLLPKTQAASLYTVKSTSSKTLAPGITQKIHTASYGDGTANVKYYVATADITRSDVMVLNGYKDNNPKFGACNSVTVDQQILASDKAHQDPNNPSYIENYRVVAGCNGGFFNIPSISGIPNYMGAHIMEGVQYWKYDGRPFLAILKDGTAVVGAGTSDWNKYREHMQEAISGNVLLVNKGKNNTGNVDEDKAFVGQESGKLGTGRHPRTCCGVTKDGKVVMMVIDAQATGSASVRGGATLNEAAQMLIDAGCYYAINMDGGGSSTYLTKEEGQTTPTLINKPSDGSMRAICGSLLFASTAPQDHLSFEFDGTGSQRYMRKQYARRNYDLANYWATGLAGSLSLGNYAVVMDNTAGTMTINLNDRGDNGHSTYFAPGAKDGNFNEAEATTSTAFTYNPSNAEVFRIRLKFNDATRYSSTNTPFVGFSYLPGDTRTWSGFILKTNLSDEYIDGGAKEGQYVTLEIDLSNHKIRNCPSLVSMMIQIGYLKKGTCTIDSIYIGPKSGNKLHFGFSEIGTNLNGFNDPAYGHLDFDKEGHWYKGGELSSYDINHGVLTMTVDNSPSNLHNAYVETSLTSSKSVHPLFYTPKAGDILLVRYKVESYDATTNTSLYGASQAPTMTIYGYNDRQNIYKNPSALTIDTSKTGYVVKEWTVPTEWTTYDMSKLRLTMRYFVNSTIKIDFIYVGPRAEAPAYNQFFIGFDNTDADKARYEGVSYGGMNMDAPGNWSVGTEYNLPVVSGGAIQMTPTSADIAYGYIHSGGGTGAYPLYYKPNAEDYIQVRFKIDNGVSSDKYESQKGNGRFALYVGNKSIGARESYVYHDFKVADVSNKGYVIFTYKLKDMKTNGTNPTALSEITSISPCFNWIKSASGKTVKFYIDYIYIGPLGTAPTPQYTVTFKDAAGNILATQKVYRGYSASYSGPSPTKAADASNHYTFKGWDKSANNIQADTVITAQYTATAHSFSYSNVDTGNHKASCSCGYSRNEAHSYSYKATTNPTTTATGAITGTCSKCAQTTTVTLPKLNTTDYTKTTTTAPTCTATGVDKYTWKTTTYGTYSFNATTAALGHSYTSKVTAPTCTAQGYTTHTCSRCSNSYKDTYVAAKGHTEVIDKAVVPTCSAAGKTEGKHCSVCKAVLVAQQTVPATGHSYIYTKVNAMVHLVTCKSCSYSVEAAHSYKDGFCVCGEPEIKEPVEDASLKLSHSLNLASDITVNFAVPKSLLDGFDLSKVYVLTEVETYEGNSKTGTTTLKLLPTDQGNYYYFTLDGMTAVQMNDRLRSVLYGTKDAQPYFSSIDDYSIADYAYSQLNKGNASQKLKTLCADLLRYGSKAQIFKAYRTDSLADSKMTNTHKTYLSDIASVTFGNTNKVLSDLSAPMVSWAGKALDLQSKVTVKYVINTSSYSGAMSDLSLHISYVDLSGNTATAVVTKLEDYSPATGHYAFSFDGLLVAELRTVLSAQIYSGNKPVSCTLQYSADTYGNNKTGTLGDLCKALFAYSDSAKAYFM